MSRIAIIGSGAWGTALAISLAQRGHTIALWSHTAEVAECIAQYRENRRYLPGFTLPDTVQPTASLLQALDTAEIVVGVMPSTHVHEIYTRMTPHLTADQVLVSATKGIVTSGADTARFSANQRGHCAGARPALTALRGAQRPILRAGGRRRPAHGDDHRMYRSRSSSTPAGRSLRTGVAPLHQ